MKKFVVGERVSLPLYSRTAHNPVEIGEYISEENSLLLIEGLWLLFDEKGWEKVQPLLDYCIFIDADKNAVKAMVLARHERGGRSAAEAKKYYDAVDAHNFNLVISTKDRADIIISSYYAVK